MQTSCSIISPAIASPLINQRIESFEYDGHRITNYEIDLLYTRLRNAGALGGKLAAADASPTVINIRPEGAGNDSPETPAE